MLNNQLKQQNNLYWLTEKSILEMYAMCIWKSSEMAYTYAYAVVKMLVYMLVYVCDACFHNNTHMHALHIQQCLWISAVKTNFPSMNSNNYIFVSVTVSECTSIQNKMNWNKKKWLTFTCIDPLHTTYIHAHTDTDTNVIGR